MSQPFELTVESDLQNLERIAEFVLSAAAELGLDDQQSFEVQMAVDEACTNIIQHAYGPGQPGAIYICCEIEGDDLMVTLRDRGRAFDPSQVPEPDLTSALEERQVGGLGLHFIRKLMDRISFHSGSEGNELRMAKRRLR